MKDARLQTAVGRQSRPSHLDPLSLRRLYGCPQPAGCLQACRHLGFPTAGCGCRCPAGTHGTWCEAGEANVSGKERTLMSSQCLRHK